MSDGPLPFAPPPVTVGPSPEPVGPPPPAGEPLQQPVPRGIAPFDWRGHPGVPLLGARRSLWSILGIPIAAFVIMVLGSAAAYGWSGITDLPPDARALAQLGVFAAIYASWFGLAALGGRATGVPFGERVALRPFSAGLGITAAVVAMLLGRYVQIAWGTFVVVLGVEVPKTPLVTEIFPTSALGIAISFAVVGLMAPLAEELVFRGVLYAGLRDRFGEVTGIVVSAMVFSAIHMQWFVFLPFFVLGALFARIVAQTRSLWPAVISHSLFNITTLALTYLVFFLTDGALP